MGWMTLIDVIEEKVYKWPLLTLKVARNYSCMASTTAINNAAASQLLTIN